ncbi:MAG: DUF1385 domain-containing protein [Bacillota bacterium]|nr:DUF1385 domain-containing protein [Bacillota bacterium]
MNPWFDTVAKDCKKRAPALFFSSAALWPLLLALSESHRPRRTSIGGQALIEGLLMMGPDKRAMVNRLPSGELRIREEAVTTRPWLKRIPLLRGAVGIIGQLKVGMAALMESAELQDETEESAEPAAHKERAGTGFALLTGILAGIGLFILLPNLIVSGVLAWTGLTREGLAAVLTANLLEALVRIGILLGYLYLTSRIEEIHRVWQYHGAEHKSIACYEAGDELIPENVARCSRFHPRCGTSFLFLIVFVSALLFALVGWHGILGNLLLRLALIPLVAGLSYEVLRFSGSHADDWYGRALARPGLWLQRLTTAEPDEGQIVVALTALLAVIPQDQERDAWEQR